MNRIGTHMQLGNQEKFEGFSLNWFVAGGLLVLTMFALATVYLAQLP